MATVRTSANTQAMTRLNRFFIRKNNLSPFLTSRSVSEKKRTLPTNPKVSKVIAKNNSTSFSSADIKVKTTVDIIKIIKAIHNTLV